MQGRAPEQLSITDDQKLDGGRFSNLSTCRGSMESEIKQLGIIRQGEIRNAFLSSLYYSSVSARAFQFELVQQSVGAASVNRSAASTPSGATSRFQQYS